MSQLTLLPGGDPVVLFGLGVTVVVHILWVSSLLHPTPFCLGIVAITWGAVGVCYMGCPMLRLESLGVWPLLTLIQEHKRVPTKQVQLTQNSLAQWPGRALVPHFPELLPLLGV